MVARVLIIGGYGTFGGAIAERLAREEDIQVIIAGRSAGKARAFADSLTSARHSPEACQLDYRSGLGDRLAVLRPAVVIHTSGPFQGQDYGVAAHCIEAGCHYIDLADARDFVVGVSELDEAARAAGLLVVSGASSVPCLTAALIDRYQSAFERLSEAHYGIATAQQTNRGLATTSAVLSYAGKPFTTLIEGAMRPVYGWQDLQRRKLPGVGRCFFGNCDVPDLALFPERYPDLKTLRFSAGLEVPVIHIGLWLLTWLVRARLLPSAAPLAPLLLTVSRLFDPLGSDVSAFYMELKGRAAEDGREKCVSFNLTARSGHGPIIPSTPAIILAKRLARGEPPPSGAQPCVGLIDLESYLSELEGLDIDWQVSGA